MKIFISWSGEKSQGYATALRNWIRLVLPEVQPWMSSVDIASGQDWNKRLTEELANSQFGIICITPENEGSPWVNFEAGAISKQMEAEDAKVAPLLFGYEKSGDFSGPLKKFQASLADHNGIQKLILDVNSTLLSPRPVSDLEQVLSGLWPLLEADFQAVGVAHGTEKAPRRSSDELLNEIVEVVRGLDARLIVSGITSRQHSPLGVPFPSAFSELVSIKMAQCKDDEIHWFSQSGGMDGRVVSDRPLPATTQQEIEILTRKVLKGSVEFTVDVEEVAASEREVAAYEAFMEWQEEQEREKQEQLESIHGGKQ